jgi:ribosomal protein S18 acetylase RimI-like enzyme
MLRGARPMVVRPARRADAAGIAAVHVAAWRSAYAGLLPADYLANLSIVRQAAQHHAGIVAGRGVLVAEAASRIVGFCTVGRPRTPGLADGEIETLYVEDDWREQGLGRQLLHSGAARLAESGCRSLFLWVLRDNPSRWFYERLGGRATAQATTQVAGRPFWQTAYLWDPIELMTTKRSKS